MIRRLRLADPYDLFGIDGRSYNRAFLPGAQALPLEPAALSDRLRSTDSERGDVATNYSCLRATTGLTRMARRAGM
jgi:hypothetical protein